MNEAVKLLLRGTSMEEFKVYLLELSEYVTALRGFILSTAFIYRILTVR